MIGGMGWTSTAELAFSRPRRGIGTSPTPWSRPSDRRFKTRFAEGRRLKNTVQRRSMSTSPWCSSTSDGWPRPRACMSAGPWRRSGATGHLHRHGEAHDERAARETLRARIACDGRRALTASPSRRAASRRSLALVQDHPRFRDVKFGIIVSSLRAAAAVSAQNRAAQPASGLHRRGRPLCRRPSRFRHGLGAVMISRRHRQRDFTSISSREGLSIPVIRRRYLPPVPMPWNFSASAPRRCRWRHASPWPGECWSAGAGSRNISNPSRRTSRST